MPTKPSTVANPADVYGELRQTSTLTAEEQAFLREVLPPERFESNGRFRRGKLAGPGRKPGIRHYNFRVVIGEYLKRAGSSIEDAMCDLFEDMMEASAQGDTGAARLLVERFCGKENEQLEIEVSTAKLSAVERLAKVRAIFAGAERRMLAGARDATLVDKSGASE